MNNEQPQKKRFSLIRQERIFRDRRLVSFYNKFNKPVEKKYKPFDYNGHRYRLNLITGELEYYDMKLCKYISECSTRRTKILLGMLLEMNTFDYFCTFTFNKAFVNRTDENEVYSLYKKFANNLKHQFPNLAYVVIPERHKVSYTIEDYVNYEIEIEDMKGAIHFHMLLKLNGYKTKDLGFKKTNKVCCSWATKKNGICSVEYFEKTKHLHSLKPTDGLPIYDIQSFIYGYTTASKIVNHEACKTYIKKYISKSLGISTSAFKKRFYYTQNLDVPTIVKREIGDGFDDFINLRYYTEIQEIDDYKKANLINDDISSYYNNDYNVLEFWLSEEKYQLLEESRIKGYLPTTDKTPFDEDQLTIENQLHENKEN